MFDLVPFGYGDRKLFQDFEPFEKTFFGEWPSQLAAFKTDIIDQGDHYTLKADLPGVSKEDIQIDLNGNQMTISARKESSNEEKKDQYIRRERSFGSVSRSFDIANISVNGITAKFEDGVLTMNLPKRFSSERPAHRIEIQ